MQRAARGRAYAMDGGAGARWRAVAAGVAFAGLALAMPARAVAADRPSEDQMFGGAPAPAAGAAGSGAGGAPVPTDAADSPAAVPPGEPATRGAAVPPPPMPGDAVSGAAAAAQSPPPGAEARDADLLGDPNAGPRLSKDVAPEDPLRIGGQIYWRAFAQSTQNQNVKDIRFTTPSLVDGYFDARPNDRVRGYVLARMSFDPTLPTVAAPVNSIGGMGTSAPSVPLLSGAQPTRGPNVLLDQLWLRFDILHTVFITAGRQHVKWGTAHIWSPTDFLHPQARNPLAAFDARAGFTMVKAHVPWEAQGWNFYGFALLEGAPQVDYNGRPMTGSDNTSTLGQLGAAGRAEVVLGSAELGLDAVVYRGRKPKFGGDLSFGLGDFDLYVDTALRYGSEIAHRSFVEGAVSTVDQYGTPLSFDAIVDEKYPVEHRVGFRPQVTVGGTYSLKYNDNDIFTVTGEYFYNSLGYDDPKVYPGLFLSNSFQFFYTGKHYAALSAIAAAPYSWNYTTFTFTTLGNLSDQSFISRLDYSVVMLTHLRFEAFGAVNYGRREGEFRLGSPDIQVGDKLYQGFSPQSFSLGVGLRISI